MNVRLALRGAIGPAITIAAAIGVWALAKSLFGIADFVLPSPKAVADTFVADPQPFLIATGETAISATIGFAIAAAGGIAIGSMLSLSTRVERSVYPITLLFQMVPLVAIAPLLVIWCGYGRPAVVASTAIVAIFPVIANTLAGLRSRAPELDELFRVLGAGRFATWRKLAVPSAVPSIVTGLRIAAGLATIGTITGEFLAAEGGERAPLGIQITTAMRNFQTDRVFVAVVLAACVGFALFGLTSLVSRAVLGRWMRTG
ncbi:MAG: ABC transporter permease [Planctomycetaceae bacterium]|nr:ABC transporter permease [Planctomycetaceae bacterium]